MSGVAGWKTVDPLWSEVDALIDDKLVGEDPAVDQCLANSIANGLPDIAVSRAQGRFLQMLIEINGAKRVLEIGTLGGLSTIYLARGVGDDGNVVTLESERAYAKIAEANLDKAGVGDRVAVVVGVAIDSLKAVDGPFDFTFIDADKVNNIAYVEAALSKSRDGALIVVDNVVREGHILDPQDESAIGTRALYEHLQNHPELQTTALQTVGAKGWDGMLFAKISRVSN